MKIIKLLSILFIACFFSLNANAQKKEKDVDTTGVFCNMQDEIVYMFGTVSLLKEDVTYFDKNNEWTQIRQKNIKWMYIGNRAFVCYPLKDNGYGLRLMEILAVNNKYILLQYWWEWYYYFVIDTSGNVIEPKIKVYDRKETIGASKNNENVMEIVKEYFGDCPELLNAMKDNFDKKQILSTDIVNIQCGDGMPIMEIIEMLNNKGWYKKKK
jgi:hypothetical protein